MSDVATYKQLTEVLSRLGFQAQANGSVMVYTEEGHDAVIVLPQEEADTLVPPHYVVAARETVYGKGIAHKQNFDQLLGGFARVKPTVSHKTTPPNVTNSVSVSSHRNKPKAKTPSRSVKTETKVLKASKKRTEP